MCQLVNQEFLCSTTMSKKNEGLGNYKDADCAAALYNMDSYAAAQWCTFNAVPPMDLYEVY
jgi:hypothetical protein